MKSIRRQRWLILLIVVSGRANISSAEEARPPAVAEHPLRTPSGEPDTPGPIGRAAGAVLAEAFKPENRSKVFSLLADRNPAVRRQAATALQLRETPLAPNEMAQLAKLVTDTDVDARQAAVAILAQPVNCKGAIAQLTVALRDPDFMVVWHAADGLKKAGPAAAPAVDSLIALLDDPLRREKAAGALGAIGPAARPAVAKLMSLLGDEGPGTNRLVSEALGRLATAAELLERKDDPQPKVRRDVISALRWASSNDERVVSALIQATFDDNEQVRSEAMKSLALIRPTAERCVTALSDCLKSKHAVRRQQAVRVFQYLEPTFDGAVGPLTQSLADADPSVRAAAAHSLANFVSDPRARLLALAAAVRDDDALVVKGAHLGVAKRLDAYFPQLVGLVKDLKTPQDALPGLVKLLTTARSKTFPEFRANLEAFIQSDASSKELKLYAAACLLHFDRSASDLEPIFLAGLKLDRADARATAAECLSGRLSEAAIGRLLEALTDRSDRVVAAAIRSLADPKAEWAVNQLCDFVADPNSPHGEQAVKTLGAIGKGGDRSARVLMKALAAGANLSYLPESLGQIVTASKLDAAPLEAELRPLIRHEDPARRQRAVETLAQLPPEAAAKALPELTALLSDENDVVRTTAVAAIGRLGERGKEAAPALVAALTAAHIDPESHGFQQQIVETLGEIGGDPKIVVPTLVTAMGQDGLTDKAIVSLGRYGAAAREVVPALIKMLDQGNDRRCRAVLAALQKLGPHAKEAVPALLKLHQNEGTRNVRVLAAGALLAIAPADADVLKQIAADAAADPLQYYEIIELGSRRFFELFVAGVGHDDEKVRDWSLRRISELPNRNEAYQRMLDDARLETRVAAAAMLAGAGQISDKTAPILFQALAGDDPKCTHLARDAGITVGRRFLPVLTAIVTSPKSTPAELAAACRLIGELRLATRKTIPALAALRRHSDPKVRDWATLASAQLDPRERTPAVVVPLLSSADPQMRAAAVSLLTVHGWQAPIRDEKQVSKLISLLYDENEEVRNNAGSALANCRFSEAQAAELAAAVANPKSSEAALGIFIELDSPPPSLVPALMTILGDEGLVNDYGASYALVKIGAPAVAPLLKVAGDIDANNNFRKRAILALGDMTQMPPDVVKYLTKLVADAESPLCRYAAEALAKHDIVDASILKALAGGVDSDGIVSGSYVGDEVFEKLGPKAALILPDLIHSLKHNSPSVREEAGKALLKIDARNDEVVAALVGCLVAHPADGEWLKDELVHCGAKAVPHLVKGLSSKNPAVVSNAALVLGYIGPPAGAALSELRQLLKAAPTQPPAVRAGDGPAAGSPFDQPGKAPWDDDAAELRGAPTLDIPQPESYVDVPTAAAEAIVHIDPTVAEAVPMLLAALEKSSEEPANPSPVTLRENRRKQKALGWAFFLDSSFGHTVTTEIARVLARAGSGARGAGPIVARKLMAAADDDQYNSWAKAAGTLGSLAADAAPILIANLKNPARTEASADALAKIGPAGEAAVPVLLEMLKDDALAVEAASALRFFGKAGARIVPVLVELLRSGDDQLTVAAAEALGAVEPPPHDAAPHLVRVIEEGPRNTPFEAALALQVLRSPAALPALVRLVAHEDDIRSNAAMEALAYGAGAESSVTALAAQLKCPSRRVCAALALGALGPKAAAAVPELTRAIAETDDDVSTVIEALGDIGPPARPALPQLEKHLKSANRWTMEAAETAIWKIDPARARELKLAAPKPEDKEG